MGDPTLGDPALDASCDFFLCLVGAAGDLLLPLTGGDMGDCAGGVILTAPPSDRRRLLVFKQLSIAQHKRYHVNICLNVHLIFCRRS